MTWARVRSVPLTRTIGTSPIEWWLVYTNSGEPHWWNRWLQPGFQHVTAMRRDGRIWVHIVPSLGFTDVDVLRTDLQPWELFPNARIQRVVSLRSLKEWRAPWVLGPVSCVELVKGLLGIKRFWLMTPYQLFRHCERGVLDHG